MSIVSLKKVTFYGLLKEKVCRLAELQEHGCLHLIPLEPRGDKEEFVYSSLQARNTLKFLLSCPERRRQVHNPAEFDASRIEGEALDIQAQMQSLQAERDSLVPKIRTLQPWGNFSIPPPDSLGNFRMWFYVIPHYQMKQMQDTTHIWQEVNHDNRFSYVVVVAKEEPLNLPGSRADLGEQSLLNLETRLEEIEVELDDLWAQRLSLTRWLDLFVQNLNQLEDKALLESALKQTYDADPIFVCQAWTPQSDLSRLQAYARTHSLAMVVKNPDSRDTPPTFIANPELVSAGKDLVSFYITPGYRSWDPSTIVFISFAVFFAMILSDAGYAALLGLFLLFMWRSLTRTPTSLKYRNLFLALVLTSTVWGILAGSYFGIQPGPETLLAKLKIFDVSNSENMILLSILMGVVHVLMANLVEAYRNRRSQEAFSRVGWVLLILGATGFWLSSQKVLPPNWEAISPWIMAGGGLSILLFKNPHPKLSKRLWGGLLELARLPNAFGDILSYLRLFALGLASASLAMAFNNLAVEAARTFHGFGMLIALFILVLGHGLNFSLAIVSGFVHGLRLNFIEFFNWSLSEEGYPFRAFAKKEEPRWSKSSSF
ncbi:MAG: V-type ATP synthase subunit I [Nitrospirales bacterium]|nr:MAG: V-type ATP synthase subunit I [Nitrospirales bacterium]